MTSDLLRHLENEGYAVAHGLLDPGLIERLRSLSAGVLAGLPADHREKNRSQGSLVPLAEHPGYGEVIGCEALRSAYREMGFTDPRMNSGYLISKPPGGPPLFWHQDWWGWDHPISYSGTIAQVFVMIYLSDTSPENGCLRVVPGSHRAHHALHDAEAAHGDELSRVTDPSNPLYGDVAGAVDVPVTAGDVVFGDARLLHGAYANRSDAERSLLTIWIHPHYASLPAAMRARIRAIFDREGADTDSVLNNALNFDQWPEAEKIADLFPPPADAEPYSFNRTPDWAHTAMP